ncbi:MAG: hypothetical protein M3R35_08295 [Candidatus Eremiobacteraeota bacterium]|nr:hypothetical protein [Candidatus Eremiobacteraeota bacterium]
MLTLAQVLPPIASSRPVSIAGDPNRAHMLNATDWAVIAALVAIVAAVILGKYISRPRQSARRASTLAPEPVRVAAALDQAVSIVEAFAAKSEIDVWVNPRSGIYFMRGHRWYEATRDGFRLSLEEANARGYRPSGSKAASCAT